jgi:hypothetical protein
MHLRTIKALAFSVGIVMLPFVEGMAQTAPAAAPSPKLSPASAAVPKKAATTTAAPVDTVVAAKDTSAADSLVPKVSTFSVITRPDSVQVFLNDSLRGVAPCTVSNVIPGVYTLVLKKVGCYLKKAEITVDSSSGQEFTFTLLRPAVVRVESNPSGAEVSIDGKKTGVTPWENDKVKPGDYSIGVKLASYKPVEKKLTSASMAHDTLRFQLEHTEAYRDSVVAAQKAEAKARKEHFNGLLASALFILGAVVVLVFELMND